MRELAKYIDKGSLQKYARDFCMRLVDTFIINFRVYLLKSLCKYFARPFKLEGKLPREFYG